MTYWADATSLEKEKRIGSRNRDGETWKMRILQDEGVDAGVIKERRPLGNLLLATALSSIHSVLSGHSRQQHSSTRNGGKVETEMFSNCFR